MTTVWVERFEPFLGVHCETVATGSLLKAAGCTLSEPMLFGLGEGLSFVFLNLASLPLPFVGGRGKPFELTRRLCRNLAFTCRAQETSSPSKAWSNLATPLLDGQPVGLQLDAFHLDYFSKPFHFAGHCVAAHGFDDERVWLVDTVQQGTTHTIERKRLELARFEKGPMAARARSWTIEPGGHSPDLPQAILAACRACAADYLAPPFKGASYLGIEKLAASLPKWLTLSRDPSRDMALAAMLMERAGTGGALFRNLYRDFLREAAGLVGARGDVLAEAAERFAEAAARWTAVAQLIELAGVDGDGAHLADAARHCQCLANVERQAMTQMLRGLAA